MENRQKLVQLNKEGRILDTLRHPNVVEFIEYVNSPPMVVLAFIDGVPLKEHLRLRGGKLTEESARHKLRQLVNGVEYLHQNNVVHLDIKPANIIVTKHLNKRDVIKIIDFGLSCDKVDKMVDCYCGTPEFTAPEIFRFRPFDAFRADIWSLGVVFFTCLTGNRLHLNDDPLYYDVISDCDVRERISECEFPSHKSEELIRLILKVDPQDRIDLKSILGHPWFH